MKIADGHFDIVNEIESNETIQFNFKILASVLYWLNYQVQFTTMKDYERF